MSLCCKWTYHFLLAGAALISISCTAPPRDADPEALGRGSFELDGATDALYVGDRGDNSIEHFDAATGDHLGRFVRRNSGGLHGPSGLVFGRTAPAVRGNLLVANQNTGRPYRGEILEYHGLTGDFLRALVPRSNPDAPFAPRGIILTPEGVLHVADVGGEGADKVVVPGRVARYDSTTGAFLGDLDSRGFVGGLVPRGLVVGPEGNLYVSTFNPENPLDGRVLRFDRSTGAFLGIVVDGNNVTGTNDPCGCNLNRPEGLAFAPDGKLHVTSFRANANDTDKILIFALSGGVGTLVDKIDLDVVGQPRAFAQALVFGPEGLLFAPITGDGPDTGAVRRYDVQDPAKPFDVFVPPNAAGGELETPFYLTFCNTNPATLAYDPHPTRCQTP